MVQSVPAGMVAVREWITSKCVAGDAIDLDVDLIENRLIDSLDFAEFLFLLEQVSGKAINLEQVDLDSFRTLRSIQSRFLPGDLT